MRCSWAGLPAPDAIILALDDNESAHLVKARAQALAHAVRERLLCGAGRNVEEVRSEDRDPFLVIARIDDLRHCILHPLRGFGGSELVKHQHFGFINGRQNVQFARLRDRIVAVLDLFQKIAEVIEEARDQFLPNQLLDRRYGQMCFPHATGADDQKPTIHIGIVLDQTPADIDSRLLRAILDFVVIQSAFGISRRDARSFKEAFYPLLWVLATAASPDRSVGDVLPSRVPAVGAHHRGR